ncbi:ATP synthase subunit I [Pseudalkalibacillus salsuginis]|uniref:ATP synthase subunit I n=1 Tax=Pseudalkalibacillus salsuginis TaxID=2910972 RepID=UPI001F2169BB|nr:ATP synthase subunit I [Pseudalkalibacillus salsuginis]MCF6410924.1 ATP synthase subunit I [Pseudalkalibacillus salsuginis]
MTENLSTYENAFRRYIKYCLYLLSICVLGWAVTSYKQVFLGLVLGIAVSMYNVWSMHRRIDRVGQAVTEGKKVKTMGSLSRLMTAGLAVLIATRFPEHFNLIAVVVGLLMIYLIMLIDFYFASK